MDPQQQPSPYVEKINAIFATSNPPLNQTLVDVSPSNAQSLISAAVAEFSDPVRARDILARLHSLNPSMAAFFHPKQHVLSHLPLRVIVPNRETGSSPPPAAQHIPIVSYIAVSYCWHSPEWSVARRPPPPIAPGWKISLPMVDAITRWVRPPSADGVEGIWLDQVCINQEDEAEKAHLIGAMDIIYRSARRLVVLLEDVQLSVDEQRAALQYALWYQERLLMGKDASSSATGDMDTFRGVFDYILSKEKEVNASGEPGLLKGAMDFVAKVISVRWFYRAWCIHERRVGDYGVYGTNTPMLLMFGSDGEVLALEYGDFMFIWMHVNGISRDPSDIPDDESASMIHQSYLLNIDDASDGTVSLMQHLAALSTTDCSHKRDLLSIVLNIARVPLWWDADIKDERDLVYITSLLAIAAGDVAPLVACRGWVLADGEYGEDKAKVSALDDHSIILEASAQPKIPLALPNSITSVTRDYIELDLLVFSSTPTAPSQAASEAASRIFRDHMHDLFVLAEEYTSALKLTPNALEIISDLDKGTHRALIHAWLALALDCGIAWTLRFTSAMRKGTIASPAFGALPSTSTSSLKQAATSLLSHFHAATNDSTNLDKAMGFLSCIVDPRLANYGLTPRHIPWGPKLDDFAITPAAVGRFWFAVPLAIAIPHLPFRFLKAWIIEPFDPCSAKEKKAENTQELLPIDGNNRIPRDDARATWRLRDRDTIFGCGPWNTDEILSACEGAGEGAEVVLLRRQKVYRPGYEG
ncbi:heterokaryon incompatibility protein-domain-containing protein [Podospora conica]|nr:heterokaryon incompatibility protein-domain-containing protein [Schizothecium conicum]